MARRKEGNVTTLSDAVKAHEEAQEREQQAQVALSAAQARAVAVRQQVSAGHPSVTPADLAEADDAVAHAELVLEGAQFVLPALSEAVVRAQADEFADEFHREHRQLALAVQESLFAFAGPQADFIRATSAYERFIADAQRRIVTYGEVNHRISIQRNWVEIDRVRVESCRPSSQFASEVALPTLQDVGAPTLAVNPLAELARAAPPLPT